ncbi:hypothetical protein B0H11DRAFT_2425612 [Mycena galericulata]|nr:hypothetical protein B0H11DRAFT_2425612 [Mycena galericulata]
MVSLASLRVSLRVSLFAILLAFLVVVVDLLKPAPVYLGPPTLEDHFASLLPETFALHREFERLQELYLPAILTMKYPHYDADGPIHIDIEVTRPRDETLVDDDDDYDAPAIPIANAAHTTTPRLDALPFSLSPPSTTLVDDADNNAPSSNRTLLIADAPSTIVPRPGALPRLFKAPSTTPILLAFSLVIFSVLGAGTLFVAMRLRPETPCPPARQVTPRAARATRPPLRSSGETRRCWVFPLKRGRKFRPSLPAIDERPWVPFTFDGAGFLKAVESLAREQQDAKQTEITATADAPHNDNPTSTHTRALTDGNTALKPLAAASHPRSRTAPGQLPGQLKLVPTSPTRAGAPVHRIVQVSAPQLPAPATSAPLSVPKPVSSAPQSASGDVIYKTPTVKTVLYETPAVKSPSNPVLYETPANKIPRGEILYETPAPPGLIYSTCGSNTALPVYTSLESSSQPTRRSSGVVFHGRSHRQPLSALSPNVMRHAQMHPATQDQYQYQHHAQPYFVGGGGAQGCSTVGYPTAARREVGVPGTPDAFIAFWVAGAWDRRAGVLLWSHGVEGGGSAGDARRFHRLLRRAWDRRADVLFWFRVRGTLTAWWLVVGGGDAMDEPFFARWLDIQVCLSCLLDPSLHWNPTIRASFYIVLDAVDGPGASSPIIIITLSLLDPSLRWNPTNVYLYPFASFNIVLPGASSPIPLLAGYVFYISAKRPSLLQTLLGRPSQKYQMPVRKEYYSDKATMMRIAASADGMALHDAPRMREDGDDDGEDLFYTPRNSMSITLTTTDEEYIHSLTMPAPRHSRSPTPSLMMNMVTLLEEDEDTPFKIDAPRSSPPTAAARSLGTDSTSSSSYYAPPPLPSGPPEIPSYGTPAYTSLVIPPAPAPSRPLSRTSSISKRVRASLRRDTVDLTRSRLAQTTMASVEVVGGLAGPSHGQSPRLGFTHYRTPPGRRPKSERPRPGLGRRPRCLSTSSFGRFVGRTISISRRTASDAGSISDAEPAHPQVGFIPGRSFVGRVLECGWDVREEIVRRGEWVVGLMDIRKSGALAEFITVDRHRIHRTRLRHRGDPIGASSRSHHRPPPEPGLSLAELALLPLGLAAHRAVRTLVGVDAGTSETPFYDPWGSGDALAEDAKSPLSEKTKRQGGRRALVLQGHAGTGGLVARMLARRGWRRRKEDKAHMAAVQARVRAWGVEEVVFDDGGAPGERGDGGVGAAVRAVERLIGDGDAFDAVVDTVGGRAVWEAGERLLAGSAGAGAGRKQFTTTVGDFPARPVPSAKDNFRAGLRALRGSQAQAAADRRGEEGRQEEEQEGAERRGDVDWEGEDVRDSLGAVLRMAREESLRPVVEAERAPLPFERAPEVFEVWDGAVLRGGTVVVKVVG